MEWLNDELLRERLEALDLRAWRLADAVDIHPTLLSHIRRGRRPCPSPLRRRLEIALGLRDGELLLPPTEGAER